VVMWRRILSSVLFCLPRWHRSMRAQRYAARVRARRASRAAYP